MWVFLPTAKSLVTIVYLASVFSVWLKLIDVLEQSVIYVCMYFILTQPVYHTVTLSHTCTHKTINYSLNAKHYKML